MSFPEAPRGLFSGSVTDQRTGRTEADKDRGDSFKFSSFLALTGEICIPASTRKLFFGALDNWACLATHETSNREVSSTLSLASRTANTESPVTPNAPSTYDEQDWHFADRIGAR